MWHTMFDLVLCQKVSIQLRPGPAVINHAYIKMIDYVLWMIIDEHFSIVIFFEQ